MHRSKMPCQRLSLPLNSAGRHRIAMTPSMIGMSMTRLEFFHRDCKGRDGNRRAADEDDIEEIRADDVAQRQRAVARIS